MKCMLRNDQNANWVEQFWDENLDWKIIDSVSLTSTKDIKLQNFQYKLLMRIIPSNKFLLKCHIEDSALCDFCSANIQTLNHLHVFWECTKVQYFWAETLNFLKACNIAITFCLKTITFGITSLMDNRKLRLKTLSYCLENISSLRINVWKRFQFFYTSNLTWTKDLKLKKKFILYETKLPCLKGNWGNLMLLLNDCYII